MSESSQKVWCKTADIPQNTLFMMGPPIKGFFDIWPKVGFGKNIKEYYTYFKGEFSAMFYVRKEFDSQAEYLARKMVADPAWALKVMKKIESYASDFFVLSKTQGKSKMKNLSDRELIGVYKIPHKAHLMSHCLGAALTWHADADQERVTKAILEIINKQISKHKLKLVAPVVFSMLSTPLTRSIVEKEEIKFLRLAQVISRKRKVKQVFIYSELESLSRALEQIDGEIYHKIMRHFREFDWIPYQYKGPAYTLEDFLARWQALFREQADPTKLLRDIEEKVHSVRAEQARLYKQLKLNTYQKNLIAMSQMMVHLKEYRKMVLYHGMYHYDKVFYEIAKRLGLTIDQVRAMNYWEIPDALLKNKYDADELNARLKECVAYYDGKKYVVFTGTKVKKFLASVTFEKKKMNKSGIFKGTCASPGKAKGVVKVINIPEEMYKMKQGDVLVAHNTNPNLVPAMKKARALISEAGGLTCHTAIVARELKIPCVVGVFLADKVLKDGDRVEVDATNGIVKKVKK